MECKFTAISQIEVGYEEGDNKSSLMASNLRLEISKNLDKKIYFDFHGRQKEPAIKPLTQALIHGIMNNIKFANDKGWWKEADHIKYVIDELTRAFAHVTYSDPKIVPGEMDV